MSRGNRPYLPSENGFHQTLGNLTAQRDAAALLFPNAWAAALATTDPLARRRRMKRLRERATAALAIRQDTQP